MIGFSTRSSLRMFISSWWVSSNDGGLIWFWNSGSILSWLSFVIGKSSFLKWNRISLSLRRSLCMDFLPPSGGVFRLSLARSSPGIPCRRSFGFQGSIGVLLVAYHTFKRIFRTWQVRFGVDFILNSLENRTSLSVRKISIPYPFAAEQELLVPVLRSFFGF